MDTYPIQGGVEISTLSLFMLQKPEISVSLYADLSSVILPSDYVASSYDERIVFHQGYTKTTKQLHVLHVLCSARSS